MPRPVALAPSPLPAALLALALAGAWGAASRPASAAAALNNGTADILAAKARASTPVRPDRPVPASAVAPGLAAAGVSLPALWAQAAAADAARGPDSSYCRASLLQWELSVRSMPERLPLRDAFDSLGLGAGGCGLDAPRAPPSTAFFTPYTPARLAAECAIGPFFVNATGGSDAGAGGKAAPFRSLARALAATRAARPGGGGGGVACIVLRGGVHYLGATVELTAADSGLVVAGYAGDTPDAPDAPAWVSGGAPLGRLAWAPHNVSAATGMNVWVAVLPPELSIAAVPGLNVASDAPGAVPERLWRAMYPNYDLEQFKGALPGQGDVVEWIKPGKFAVPALFYRDLKAEGLKDDSTMREYNLVALGAGGVCAHWDNPPSEWAYVCSNSTAGGWEEIERGFATTGQLGFPVGVVLNASRVPRVRAWTAPPAAPTDWSNAPTLTAWHNQGGWSRRDGLRRARARTEPGVAAVAEARAARARRARDDARLRPP